MSLAGAASAWADEAPSKPQCELHVWPAGPLKGLSQSAILNHMVDQVFDPARGGMARPEGLSPAGQLALLSAMDLPALLGLPPATLVTHETPLSRQETSQTARHAGAGSACHAELIVMQNVFDKAPLASPALKTLFLFRRFGEEAEPVSRFSTWADRTLLLYPPKDGADAEVAEAELLTAFTDNVRSFAGFATRPPKPAPPARKRP